LISKQSFSCSEKSKHSPPGYGHFQIIKMGNNNVYDFNCPSSYISSNSFNVSDLTPFDIGVTNLLMNYL